MEDSYSLTNMTLLEWIGLVIMFLGFNMSMAGGIGGGGIIVPINVIFFGLSFTHAVALSKIGIFAGSLIRWISELCQRSPKDKDVPLIDYQTAMLYEPAILAGTVVGVLFNIWLPE